MVAIGRDHVDVLAFDVSQGHIKRAATEIEDHDLHVLARVGEAVGEGGSCGFVDELEHLKASQLAGPECRSTLLIAEVCRNRDYRLIDRGARGVPQRHASAWPG